MFLQKLPVTVRKRHFPKQIGTFFSRLQQGVFMPPLFDIRMMTAEQDLRHFLAPPHRRLGILRIFQKSVIMTFVLKAEIIRQHLRNHPADTVRQHQCRQFAAGQNIIPDGNLLIDIFIQHPLINTFVMTAQDHQIRQCR